MRETNEGDLAGDEVPSEEVSGSSVASDQSAHRSEERVCCLLAAGLLFASFGIDCVCVMKRAKQR